MKRRKYGAIYADPPWSFRNWSAKGTGRNAVSHYDCISFERLTTLPIRDLAAENCVLFLWAVDPLLDKAFELMRVWGFEYKTVGFYWVKQNGKGVQPGGTARGGARGRVWRVATRLESAPGSSTGMLRAEDISSAPAEESGRCRGLAAASRRAADWRGWPNVRLPIPIAAFGPQGRFSQLSAMSGLMHRRKTGPYSMTSSARS